MYERITVMTPSYNRVNLLKNLYASLCMQTYNDFIWLVIDDGSTDSTSELIGSFISEKKIKIKYIKQENAGKYIAHNTGVKNCDTELIVCVDSDDTLMPNAIERILNHWQIANKENTCGIVSPKKMDAANLFNCDKECVKLMELYNKYKYRGETMLVYRTDILKEYLFPENPKEKYMGENVVYYQIDQHYKLSILNEFLYCAAYQTEGLTRNIDAIHWKNKQNVLYYYQAMASLDSDFLKSIKSYGCYLAWKRINNIEDLFETFQVNTLTKICGFLLRKHYLRLFEKQYVLYMGG